VAPISMRICSWVIIAVSMTQGATFLKRAAQTPCSGLVLAASATSCTR
jgi:hypothetical protein